MKKLYVILVYGSLLKATGRTFVKDIYFMIEIYAKDTDEAINIALDNKIEKESKDLPDGLSIMVEKVVQVCGPYAKELSLAVKADKEVRGGQNEF